MIHFEILIPFLNRYVANCFCRRKDNVMTYFDLIPNLGKARYGFLQSCDNFLNFAISLLQLAFTIHNYSIPPCMIATINIYCVLYDWYI